LLQLIVAIVLIIVTFGLLGWLMIRSLKWARNRDGHGQVALGHALQELDRLVARPSIENRLNTEAEVKAVNDEHGGE
jgi:cell division protein FtsX